MARQRKAKLRAQRIERDYYLRRHWFRSLRVWLTLTALVAAALWMRPVLGGRGGGGGRPPRAGGARAGGRKTWEGGARAGPKGRGGAPPPAGATGAGEPPLFVAASDGACRTCHAVPDHHANQASTPSCAS